ncbi:MAG: hypothetical protein ACI9BK_001072 [Acidimicrobiales bacterium]|jgi:hypothetical protein
MATQSKRIRASSSREVDKVDSTRSWVVVGSAFLAMFTVFGVA